MQEILKERELWFEGRKREALYTFWVLQRGAKVGHEQCSNKLYQTMEFHLWVSPTKQIAYQTTNAL